MNNKPPVGLKPKHIHDLERMKEIQGAVNRFMQEGYKIPSEWIEEYNDLVSGRLTKDLNFIVEFDAESVKEQPEFVASLNDCKFAKIVAREINKGKGR